MYYDGASMRRIKVPPLLDEFAARLAGAGHQCWLVGGATRDALLGGEIDDFDVATDAAPEKVVSLYRRVIPTGIKHGTVTVLFQGAAIEATTFRSDGDYSDARRPDSVRYAATIEEDLSRRDFTMNAIAVELAPAGGERRVVDLFGGATDIEGRTIRAIGDPGARFREDALRPLRALRFASTLGFAIEPATLAAVAESAGRVAAVAAERIREELCKLLLGADCARALALMEETGVLRAILPEIAELRGVAQKGWHDFDVLDHSFYAVEGSPRAIVPRVAALFHDAGKKRAMAVGADGIPTFHRHEEYSAEICSVAMRRLRFTVKEEREACHLVRQHMFHYEDSWTDAAVRRFVARVGVESLEGLFALRAADGYAQGRKRVPGENIEAFRERIADVLARDHALGMKDLRVGGEDLASIGVTRGPAMGRVLAELLETVLDDPSLNERERLLAIARRLWEEKYGPRD